MVIAMLRMKLIGWFLLFVINIGFSFAQVDIESPTRDTLTFTFINQDFNVLLHSASNSSEEVWIKFNPTLIFKDEATRDEIKKKSRIALCCYTPYSTATQSTRLRRAKWKNESCESHC